MNEMKIKYILMIILAFAAVMLEIWAFLPDCLSGAVSAKHRIQRCI
jgi:hypothetical protein